MADKATVTKIDIVADEGVIHVIDTVFMPKQALFLAGSRTGSGARPAFSERRFFFVPADGRGAAVVEQNGVTIWGFGAAVCVLHVHIE